MALVRILVDGYGLLHQWPKLAPGKPRHAETTRQELIYRLTQYHDSCGTPITVIFGGPGTLLEPDAVPVPSEVEVVYTPNEHIADHLIERAVYRMKSYGEVLVVTDNVTERKAIESAGAVTSDCANFIRTVQGALAELEQDLTRYNQKEQLNFKGITQQ